MKQGRLKNMGIGKKLMLSYCVIIAFYITTVIASLVGIHTVAGMLDDFYDTSCYYNIG